MTSPSADSSSRMSAARGSTILAFAFLAVGAGNYAFTLVMAYLLVPSAFGVAGFVQSFLLFTAWLTTAGFPWSGARRMSMTDDRAEQASFLRAALVGNLVIGVGLALPLLALLAVGGLKLGAESGAPVMLAALACAASGLSAASRGGLQGLLRFGHVAVANLLEVAVKLAVGVALVKAGYGATGAAAGILAGMLANTGFALSRLGDVPYMRARGLGARRLYGETLPIFFGTSGMALLASIDLFAVKLLSPESQSNAVTGLYQAAVTLARIPYFFASALTTAVFPYVARGGGTPEGSGLYVRKGVLYTVTLLAPISLAMIAEPEAILGFFFPASYASAAGALRVLAIGSTAFALSAFLVGSLQAAGRARWATGIVLLAVVTEALLLAVAVPAAARIGNGSIVMAAAISFDIASIATVLMLTLAAYRWFRWRLPIRGTAAFLLAASAFVIVIRWFPSHGRVWVALGGIVALGVYALIAVALGLLSPGDVGTLVSAVPRARVRSRSSSPGAEERLQLDGCAVVTYRGEAGRRTALPAWEALLSELPATRVFSRPAWVEAWWSVYGKGREMILVVIEVTGRPVALAPFQLTRVPFLGGGRLEFLGGAPATWLQWMLDPRGLGLAYFNDVLIAPGYEDVALKGVDGWLLAAKHQWDTVQLNAVPAESPLARHLEGRRWGRRERRREDRRAYIDVALGWDAYRAGLSKRQRRHLRYEPHALESAAGASLRLDEVRGAEAPAGMDEFIALHDRRWAAARKPGLQQGEADFYRRLAVRANSGLVVFRLLAGERVVAIQFGFDHGTRYLAYNFAFDPAFDRESPSNVLMQMVVRRFCDGEHKEIDLTGLGAAHHWSELTRARQHFTIQAPGRPAAIRFSVFEAVADAIESLMGTLPGQWMRALGAALVAAAQRSVRR